MTPAKFRLVACLIVLTLFGCGRSPSTPEGLVEAAFDAIKANDWKTYSALIITSANTNTSSMSSSHEPARMQAA